MILFSLSMCAADPRALIDNLNNVKKIASTVPANGDVNPYGVAVVPVTTGELEAGDILVSNFNNASNQQGTGTTIMEISPNGKVKQFAEINPATLPGSCPGGVGLTTALVALRSGLVIVGSLPAAKGNPLNAMAGCLIVLDHNGTPVTTLSGGDINGPWDMTAVDFGQIAVLFVTNVLNNTVNANFTQTNQGTVLRIVLVIPPFGAPYMLTSTIIGSGFAETLDPNALVIGPTGVGFSPDGTLYVADTLGNRIAAIPNALFRPDSANTGTSVTHNGSLNGPLGLAIAPNGDILTVNAGDGNMVETTPSGNQVAVKFVDNSGTAGPPPGAGTLFGLAISPDGKDVYFVDDGNNFLNLLH